MLYPLPLVQRHLTYICIHAIQLTQWSLERPVRKLLSFRRRIDIANLIVIRAKVGKFWNSVLIWVLPLEPNENGVVA